MMAPQRVGIIAESTVEKALRRMEQYKDRVDVFELRIDFLKTPTTAHLAYLINHKPKPVIIACRRKNNGGMYTSPEHRRAELFQAAVAAHADYVDLEYDLPQARDFVSHNKSSNNGNTQLILSYHNQVTTPSLGELKRLYSAMQAHHPDLIKIVPSARSILDNFTLFSLLQHMPRAIPLIAFCMGHCGKVSRILGRKYGSYFTYGSVLENNLGALDHIIPGLMTLDELEHTYNLSRITPNTKVIGVLGESVEHSLSKSLYNALFREKKCDSVFIPFSVRKEDVGSFMALFKEYGWHGASVTMPYKETILNYLDALDSRAKKIGAVNTIVLNQHRLKGHNTDVDGALVALKECTPLTHKKILVIGAGGAAKAIVYGLMQQKLANAITLTNRTYERAQRLADAYCPRINAVPFVDMRSLVASHDIIINATSVGMHPSETESLIQQHESSRGKIVMDIIYKPRITQLLKNAQQFGSIIIPGERMLLHQWVAQCPLLTGIRPTLSDAERYFANCFGENYS